MNATVYMVPLSKLDFVKEGDSVQHTLELMQKGSYKTLPVVSEQNHFVGVIHEVKLYEAFFYNEVEKDEFLKAEIRPLVSYKIQSIEKHTDFIEVILKMEKMDIHFLPVLDQDHRFLGIVTRNKIFEAFESAFGYNQDGYLIEVVAIDVKGQLARLAKAISDTGSNIVSIVQFDLSVANLERIIVKVQADNVDEVLTNIANEGFRVTNHKFIPRLKKAE
ncbi:HPP family protein [Caldalkalibacillus salinus]|uniref:CBS domain-containing protein n=1 Tax=Caldalkalibacillus salinus TaxID=2803787 RepID=UPI0019237D0A|nr:CBS domain-containing protein [Caldalkalibacillus salinus]